MKWTVAIKCLLVKIEIRRERSAEYEKTI